MNRQENEQQSVELAVGDWDGIMGRFLAVKSRIARCGSAEATHMVFRMPWNFYRTHSEDYCVKEILRRCKW